MRSLFRRRVQIVFVKSVCILFRELAKEKVFFEGVDERDIMWCWYGCTRARQQHNISVIIVLLLEILENFSLVLVFSGGLETFFSEIEKVIF